MKKNVLVVSVSAPPQNSPESLQVAKYLKSLSASWKITLVTIKKADGWRKADESLLRYLVQLKRIIRLPHFTSGIYKRALHFFFKRSIHMPDQDFLFFRQWKSVITTVKEKPDLIYSRATPFSSSIMGLRLKQYYQSPWVMHLSDPWVVSPHFKYSGKVRAYHEKMERACIEHADIVSLTSYETIEVYKQRYPQYAEKFQFFSNVYDDDELVPNPFHFTGKLKFVHAGNFYGEGRNPECLLLAIQQVIRQQPDFFAKTEFIFLGRFNEDVLKIFQKYSFPFVKINQDYSFQDSVSEQKSGHVMILIDWKFKREKSIFFLSKILGYMASRRPILAITEKSSTCFKVIDGKYGQCFDHDDQAGLAGYLQRSVANYEAKNEEFFRVQKPDPAYSLRINAENLSKAFQSLLAKK